ncbi:hypothetical protein [Herminiimonas contaminans]|uniref:Uncharacterized protein n=1 Tax=Herminiimonas contaminans TaxID=1111140 RepID=A0ABS0EQ11_9BURK|nr:hypothetical protein [Herminiimonas contaminans]MBF8176946.1 hypothetical protein [Herminiimonas contaminans]
MKDSTIKVSMAMPAIADALDKFIEGVAGERIGFTLLVFTDERASYISNVPRVDSVREIKNLLADWEAGLPDVPAHKVH